MSITPANLLSGEARCEEVARLLALAIIRRKSRQDNEIRAENAQETLDSQRVSSVHVPAIDRR